MTVTKNQFSEIQKRTSLPRLGLSAFASGEAVIDGIDKDLNSPLRLFATHPVADAILNIEANRVDLSDGSKRASFDSTTMVEYLGASINFSTGAITGSGLVTLAGAAFALPATTIGAFRRLVFAYNASENTVDSFFSDEAASQALLEDPAILYGSVAGTPMDYVDLEAVAATEYKTAGSAGASALIENLGIVRFGSGVGGGASELVISSKVETVLDDQQVGDVATPDTSTGPVVDGDFPDTVGLHRFPLAGDLSDSNGGSPLALTLINPGTNDFNAKGFFDEENVLSLDGNDQYVLSNEAALNPGDTDFTMSIWMKTSSNRIAFSQYDATNGNRSFNIRRTDGKADFLAYDSAQTLDFRRQVDYFGDPDDWHMYTLTYDAATNVARYYLDGKKVGDVVVTLGLKQNAQTQQFNIGTFDNRTDVFTAPAHFREFVFKTSVLDDDTIMGLYQKRYNLKGSNQLNRFHQLDADSFARTDLTPISFYRFDSTNTGDDLSGNGRNMSVFGAPTYDAYNIYGQEVAASLAKAGHFYSGDSFFNSPKFSIGCIARETNEDEDTVGLFSRGDNGVGNDFSFDLIWISGDPQTLVLRYSSDGSAILTSEVKQDLSRAQLRHYALTYDGELARVYLNGLLEAEFDIDIRTATAANLAFGTTNGGVTNFWDGTIEEAFYADYVMNDAEIFKLVSARLDLTGPAASVSADSLLLMAQLKTEQGKTNIDLTESFIVDKRINKLFVDFGQNPANKITLEAFDKSIGATTVGVREFDRRYTSDPGLTIAHNLPQEPTGVKVFHVPNGDGIFRDVTSQIDPGWDNTNIYVDLSILTIDATHPVKIFAGTGLGLATNVKSPDVVVANVTADADDEFYVDVSGGAFTIFFPPSPSLGDAFKITHIGGDLSVNNVTLDGNGNNINGAATQLMNTNDDKFEAIFNGTEWRLV
jgi:hypothetical protein